MHIPDGMLTTPVVAAAGAGATGAVAYAVAWTRRHLDQRRIVLMAIMAALVFALQMLNFPVAGGTSGHFAGGAATAVLLGPWASVIVMTTVLFVQAVLFADGGVLALGANVVNLGVLAPFLGYAVWRTVTRVWTGRLGRVSGAFVAAWVATVASAVMVGLEIWMSGRAPLGLVVTSMAAWHALIGIGEGVITAGLVGYVLSVRPDLLEGERGSAAGGRSVALALLCLALAAAALSFLASSSPDGLEFVYFDQGVGADFAENGLLASPAPNYLMPGVTDDRLAGVLAGLVGLVVTGAVVFGAMAAARLGRSKPSAAPPTGTVERHSHGGAAAEPLIAHAHRHGAAQSHAHPHHHASDRAARHSHAHTLSFERLTYILSPVHALDPRAKLVAALCFITGVVVSPVMRPLEFALAALLVGTVLAIARLPWRPVLLRSALVLPLAGGIALFAPLGTFEGGWTADAVAMAYRAGWPVIWAVMTKAWLSATVALLVAATTPAPRLFAGMRALGMPAIFITMFTFLHRYTEVLGEQLRSLRRAVASRGPGLSGRRLVALYGNLAGNLFIRAYERGERVYSAMLSRGFDGHLPTTEPLRLRSADLLALTTAVLAAAALALY